MTIAQLGIEVDSSQAAKGTVNLDALAASATKAEAATSRLGAGATAALKGTSFQTANLAAQIQDIAVQLQSGQNPFQIALQQGTQITQVIGQQGAKGAVASLGAAFTSLINPVTLSTIGIIAFGGLAIQAFAGLLPKVETASQALARHKEELAAITAGYDDAKKAADDFINNASQLPRGAALSELQRQFKEAQDAVISFRKYTELSATPGADDFSFMTEDMKQLIQQFNDGTLSANGLFTKLTELKNSDLGPLGFAIRPFIDSLAEAARKAGNLYDSLIGIEHIAAGLGHNEGVQVALDSMIEGNRAAQAQKIEMDAINAKSPAQQADIARRRTALQLADQQISDSLRKQKIDEAGALAYAQAAHAISEANRVRLLAANQNIAASQTELETVGRSISETQRLTFVRQQLAAAETEAAQNGTTISEAYRKEVERLGAAYGKLQQQIAVSKLGDDLAFARSQLGRSSIEQDVASQLRGIYGDDWEQFAKGVIADNIRINDTLKDIDQTGQSITEGFLSTFKRDLMQGTSLWQSFGDAAAGVLDSIADKALKMAADGIWNLIFGAITNGITGGIGGGSIGAGLGVTGGALKFANGGDFTVGGSGGTDTTPVAFLATPGERVSVRTPGQSANQNGSFTYAPTYNLPEGMSRNEALALMAQHDRDLMRRFPDMVAASQRNPYRKSA